MARLHFRKRGERGLEALHNQVETLQDEAKALQKDITASVQGEIKAFKKGSRTLKKEARALQKEVTSSVRGEIKTLRKGAKSLQKDLASSTQEKAKTLGGIALSRQEEIGAFVQERARTLQEKMPVLVQEKAKSLQASLPVAQEKAKALQESITTSVQEDLVAIRQRQFSLSVALRAALLGFVSGLRSTAPFTVLNWTRKRNPAPTNALEHFLDSPGARLLVTSLSTGELVADKLPITPSRIAPPVLVGRLGLGAIAGASVTRRHSQPLILGLALGALGAGVGSYAGYYVRTSLASKTKVPSWLLGVAEDGLTFGLGFLALKK